VRRVAPFTAMGAVACLAAAGCGTTITGARGEGPASTASVKTPSSSAPPIASDPTALAGMVRRDSSVSAAVREDLTPCAGNGYPMDTDSGNLTSGDGPDLVVNITTCGDGLGVAAYVYRMIGGKYQDVFADERPPVYGSVTGGRLQIVHEVYSKDDRTTYPTGEESVTYAWRGNAFVEVARSYSDFTAKTPTASPEPTRTDPVRKPDSEPLDPELPTPAPDESPAGPTSPAPKTSTSAPKTTTSPPATADKGR
jgi:hypothetical protein